MKNPFKLISSKEVYKNPWIQVREDSVIRPGGNEGIFGVVTIAPATLALPVTDDGYVYLTEEFKYGIGKHSVQTVMGGLDEGETPLNAAKRELREEAGLTASTWTDLSYVDSYTGIVDSKTYMFLAEGLEEVDRDLDDGEVIDLRKVLFEEALRMVLDGEIKHSATCVAILKVAKLRSK